MKVFDILFTSQKVEIGNLVVLKSQPVSGTYFLAFCGKLVFSNQFDNFKLFLLFKAIHVLILIHLRYLYGKFSMVLMNQ